MSSSHPNHNFDDELLSAYVDNELTAEERFAVEERLRTDESARRLVDELRAASEAVKSLPRVSLGHDLKSSVLAEIERRQGGAPVEPPAVLTMPVREGDERRPRGTRPLVWAAFAVAAALLLMAILPGDRLQQSAPVAGTTSEKSIGADAEARGPSVLAEGGRGKAGNARSDSVARSSAAPSKGEMSESRYGQGKAEPLRARPGAVAEESAATYAAAAPPAEGAEGKATPATDVADEGSALSILQTYELTVADDGGVAAFEQLLGEQKITLSSDEAPTELRRLVEQRDEAGAAGAAVAVSVDAVLIEASAAEIEALVTALRRDPTAFRDLKAGEPTEEKIAGRGRGAGGGGFRGASDGAATRGARETTGGEAVVSRAWRMPLRGRGPAVMQRNASATPPSEGAPPAAPASGATQPSTDAGKQKSERVRVLFILRRSGA